MENKCIDCSKVLKSTTTKRCNSCAQKYRFKYQPNPMKGKKRPDLSEYNRKFKSEQMKQSNPMKRPEVVEKHRVPNLKKGHPREKNPAWQGGKSFELYGLEWNEKLREEIRKRDNYTCQVCGKEERRLDVHHIDYNKKNNLKYNLIGLCHNCHTKTCFNRKYWTKFFQEKVADIYAKKYEIDIMILTRDRHTELALLLQSLRTQIFKNWNVYILDDASGKPIIQSHFLVALINRIKIENHKVKLIRNDNSFGCCFGRNKLLDEVNEKGTGNLSARFDDDVILEPDYLLRMLNVIEAGYDIASGVVPLLSMPEIKRKMEFVKPIINEHRFDTEGNLLFQNDDCGFCYIESKILKTHQFRTNAVYKSEINKKVRYPNNLSYVAFREEGFFSISAILAGYKIGVDTGAITYHLQCPSGGNRCPDYNEKVKIDNETYRKWMKKQYQKHGDFLK